MKAIVLIISLLWWIDVQAQCDKNLVQKATEQVGKDEVLVRDFKVKLKDGDRKNPSPSGRYTVLMQKGISYKFNVVGANENQEVPVIQLYDKSNLLASSFDFEMNRNDSSFQYLCQRTGDYQVILFFRNRKAGCLAGVMSMIVDSAFLSTRQNQEQSDDDVLYLGVENHLSVSTDSLGEDKLEVSLDNGVLINKGTYYIIKVDQGTNAKVTVKQRKADGNIKEETVKNFKIVKLPEPLIYLEKAKEEYVNVFELGSQTKLVVKPFVYKILSFNISKSRISPVNLMSNSEFLTQEQLEFIKGIKTGDRFYINNIQVERPDGTIIDVAAIEYYVR